MKIVDEKNKIEIAELKEMAKRMFGNLVKAMVDIEKEILAVDAELHSDLMDFLIETENSAFKNLWGINLYPVEDGEDFIVFDSLINIRPGLGNKTMGVDDPKIRKKIINVVYKLCQK